MANDMVKKSASTQESNDGNKSTKAAQKKKAKEVEDLSEEDRKKKEELDMLVERAKGNDKDVAAFALNILFKEISTSTSSVTSVPKPLKLLRPHFESLTAHYESLQPSDLQKQFADVLSILSTTYAKDGNRLMLRYRLEGTPVGFTAWGHEYIRNLAGEIAAEFSARVADGEGVEDLLRLVREIVPFYMKHNAECEAVDLACEVDEIESIEQYVDKSSYQRVVLYILSMCNFCTSMEEQTRMLKVAYSILMAQKQYPDALRIAMKKNDSALAMEIIKTCEDPVTLKQLALMCSRHRIHVDFKFDERLMQLAAGELLPSHFQYLAKELDVLEPKLPEDVYKVHLEERRTVGTMDSAKQNLASTFVNAFVNAGFCKDKLMTVDGYDWLYKNKDHGMMSAVASVGVLLLWNVEEGLSQIDKFQYSADGNVKAGASIAFGLVNANVTSECDPAIALLSENLEGKQALDVLGAILGLGFAYAGANRMDLLESLIPCVIDTSLTVECSAMAAVSLGLIFVGSCNQEVAEAIVQAILERNESEDSMFLHTSTFFAVGLGLVFLGRRDACEATLSALEAVEHPVGKYAACTVEGMAAAGSGNELKIQKMLQLCVEKREGEADDIAALDQAVAVLNIPLIALAEDAGAEMSVRLLDRLLQYADINQRKAIPLALALHSPSTVKPTIVDTLYKLTHDADADVALNAILSLGIVGAGTNNSRIASLLRQLAAFYARDSNGMFVIRIAQGLLYMGKGLLSINPLHSDRFLLHPVALGSLLVLFHACLQLKENILGRQQYLLYYLVLAMFPRMLLTVDEDLNPLHVSVRVGQAVDVVGQAGQPKRITGFQTHTTPVLLSSNERAELATDEYLPVSSVLEGVIILRKNPAYRPTADDQR